MILHKNETFLLCNALFWTLNQCMDKWFCISLVVVHLYWCSGGAPTSLPQRLTQAEQKRYQSLLRIEKCADPLIPNLVIHKILVSFPEMFPAVHSLNFVNQSSSHESVYTWMDTFVVDMRNTSRCWLNL